MADPPTRAVLSISPAKDIVAVLHYADGQRRVEWLGGLWSAWRFMWHMSKDGIPVDVEP